MCQVFVRVIRRVRISPYFWVHHDDAAIIHQLQDEVGSSLAVENDDVQGNYSEPDYYVAH